MRLGIEARRERWHSGLQLGRERPRSIQELFLRHWRIDLGAKETHYILHGLPMSRPHQSPCIKKVNDSAEEDTGCVGKARLEERISAEGGDLQTTKLGF